MLTSHPASLTEALETISEALFFEQPIPVELRQDVIALLVSRQVQVGPDSGFFIPFNTESGPPSRLFSGEQLHTEFARRHIQLIETARILQRLAHADPLLLVQSNGPNHAWRLCVTVNSVPPVNVKPSLSPTCAI
jgi:hypothetical protein